MRGERLDAVMKSLIQNWAQVAIDPRRLLALRHLPSYFADWIRFRRMAGPGVALLRDSFPLLSDRVAATPFDPHYFHQGAWLARRLAQAKPQQHVDVGSSVLTMGVLSAHVPTVFVDFRPLMAHHAGLSSVGGDIGQLPFADAAIPSLSCLHVIEHVGLGRYGDPLDPDGARKAACELQRVLARGGSALSVDAHRPRARLLQCPPGLRAPEHRAMVRRAQSHAIFLRRR